MQDKMRAVCTILGKEVGRNGMNITDAQEEKEYTIRGINTDDDELNTFLFTLGCYAGEPVTLVSHRQGSYVIAVKDGRYSIDTQLAEAIEIQ